ncbi:MAG TPA: PQQ-binding-like beta-propeller repeat protein [Gaiellaceae bacterium]|nr:PQQ-binding-like beta-propeller repeat protein [Gaiellaceae bacterium]
MRRRLAYTGAGLLVLLIALGTAAYLYRKHQGRDIRGSSTVEFVDTEPKAVKEPQDVTWPLYGYDPARLRSPFGLKLRPPFRAHPVWTFHGHALLEFPPVIAYGRIYIVNNKGEVFALSESRGKVQWKYPSHRCSAASPAVGNHLVFVALLNKPPCNASHGADGKVIAFDAETGRIRWQRTIGPSESSPLLARNTVYVGDWSHNVYAFTASTGNLRWHYHAGGLIKGAISLSGNRVFFGSYDTHVYALDASTGRQVWRASSQPRIGRTGTFYANPAVAYDRVYLGATDGKMYSYGATSGKLRWSNGTGDFIYSSAAVWRRNVMVGSYDGTFYSFDAATGDVRWRFHAGGKISGSPSVIDGIVYFSTLSGRTFALNARTGKLVWSYPAGEYAAVIASKKRLYLVGYSKLYALIPHARG